MDGMERGDERSVLGNRLPHPIGGAQELLQTSTSHGSRHVKKSLCFFVCLDFSAAYRLLP